MKRISLFQKLKEFMESQKKPKIKTVFTTYLAKNDPAISKEQFAQMMR